MSTYLRCAGEELDVDCLQQRIDLEPALVWKKGEKRSAKSKVINKNSGISFCTSDADMEEFDEQVKESIEWLSEYAKEVALLLSFEGVEEVTLDFGIALKEDSFVNSDYLPPELLCLAGKLGIGIELSHYPASKDN